MASSPATRLTADEVDLVGARGPLPPAAGYDLVIDASGLTLSGGDPIAAWQIPYSAMVGTSVTRRGTTIEVGAWIAGGHLGITIAEDRLEGGTAQDLEVLLATATGRAAVSVGRAPRTGRSYRTAWLLVAMGSVLAAVGIVLAVGLSSSSSKPSVTPAQRAATSARNLDVSDLPAGWSTDDPTSAPLSGLLSTGSGSKPTPAEKAASKKIVANYESCMGISYAKDRVFGAAGVTPVLQLSSDPIGSTAGSSFFEVGSSTQRYASADQVEADLTQLRAARFPTCFAEAIGRLAMNDGAAAAGSRQLVVTPLATPRSLGVFLAGATVTIAVPSGQSTVPAQIGVTILVHDVYEQTLYTFSTPGAFPLDLQQSLDAVLASRLVGASGAASA